MRGGDAGKLYIYIYISCSIQLTCFIAVLFDGECIDERGGTAAINEKERDAGKFCYISHSTQPTYFIAVLSNGECINEHGGAAAMNKKERDAGKFIIYPVVHNQCILLQFHLMVNVTVLQSQANGRRLQVSFIIYVVVCN